MSLKKLLLALSMAIIAPCYLLAQVTTGSITGTVKDDKGAALAGATVKAVHEPTGSVYQTVTKASGNYVLPNLRVGGPYTVTITYVGLTTQSFTDLNVQLGTPLVLESTLQPNTGNLGEIKITGSTKGAIISSDRTGPSTNISLRTVQNLPTLSRSIQDYARLTPQAVSYSSNTSNSPLGISFAGQNNRYNQFTIDGANATDVFGLAATGTNGGQANANPIPIESIQELQIILSPYDVTLGGFTGGGMNAVTKSGTNVEHGSAYYVMQNQGLVGNGALNTSYPQFKNYTFGASLGGKIIKNKLFYFVNVEHTDTKAPIAYDPTNPNSGSKFNTDSLAAISAYMNKKWGLDPGSYAGISSEQYATYVFGRIDWNISDKTKLTIRDSYVNASNYVISRSPTTLTFANGGYYMLNTSNSIVAELNSNFSAKSSNTLRLVYNAINDHRTTQAFPSITIYSGTQTYYLGGDYSSAANSLKQNNYNLTDNYTMYRGKHTITVGTDDDFYNTTNVFLQDYDGGYNFNSIADFLNNTNIATYYISYGTGGPNDQAPAKMHAAQFSVYGGDVWAVKDNFKLTYGLRIDAPVFFNKPSSNYGFDTSSHFGGVQNATVPKSTPLWSPRVGFNWDVNHNGKTQLRGGAGLFTGRIPFVWISNMYTNTGVASIKSTTNNPTTPNQITYDPTQPHLGAYIPPAKTTATEIDVTDPHFKFPQVLRANLAIDQKLPWWGLIGTLEGIFTKTINNINYTNLNVGAPTGTVQLGNTTRPWYNFTRVTNQFTDVLEVGNTSKGYGYNLTAQLQKPFSRGWSGSIAYTYGQSYSLNDGTSSTAISNWRYAYNINGLNNLDVARSNYSPGSRIVGYISKQFRYAGNRLATTIGLVYIGQQGLPFSYMFSKNINGDDVSSKSANADLAYLPTDDSHFATLTRSGTTVSAAQQFQDLNNFEAANHISKYAGQNLLRNDFHMPWESHFDLKVSEDIFLYKQHRLEITFACMNVANLLDRKWGWSYYLANQDVNLLTVVSQTQTPTYTFDITKMNNIKGTYRPWAISDFNSRWRGQLEFKYSF
ncbi:MAG TPA: carboxypeptidase regulatory-like domain-containing protein [Dinghuibacter sp.]|uniref:TonB-dependent receptor n=1 Tax=Dinghuibacter sp. TaxID=2024697 RepID=UPI002CCD791B|nr:carboxypeptidase regulatory-like domain-containing protein [Dinghuibacter sp.]HTJ11159.1 carboxypeptidase regulatory-like domain-containing protein [Dinghuibacter sp.]